MFFGPEPPVYDVVMEIGRIPRRRLKEFLKQVSTNREKLYREWDTKVIVED